MSTGKEIKTIEPSISPDQYIGALAAAGVLAVLTALFRQTKIDVTAEHISGLTLNVSKEIGETKPSSWSIERG
jgi:hypothetical protein